MGCQEGGWAEWSRGIHTPQRGLQVKMEQGRGEAGEAWPGSIPHVPQEEL